MAPGELVSANSFESGCDLFGGMTSMEFGSVMLVSTEGNLGERSIADELRLGVSHRREVPIPVLGTFVAKVFVTHRAYGKIYGFEQMSDDYSTVGIWVSRPITFGSWKLEPCYWNEKWNPINNMNSLNFSATCLGVEKTSVLGGTLYASVTNMRSENSTTAAAHKNPLFGDAGIRWSLPYDLTLAIGLRYNRYGAADAKRDLCVAQDARLYFCSGGGKNVPLPQFDPVFTLTRYKTF